MELVKRDQIACSNMLVRNLKKRTVSSLRTTLSYQLQNLERGYCHSCPDPTLLITLISFLLFFLQNTHLQIMMNLIAFLIAQREFQLQKIEFSYLVQIIIDRIMHTTKNIEKFRQKELSMGVSIAGSWHNDYSSAYIFIGNLNYEMNQGDIVIVFSEWGEIVDIRLARDRQTGKSRGFAFLAYEDQRSTNLAVDNFNGAEICGRVLRVDHVKKYDPPKQFLDLKQDAPEYKPTGPDGRGWGRFRQKTETEKQADNHYRNQMQKQKNLLQKQIGLKE